MADKPTRNDTILDLTRTTYLDLIADFETYPGRIDRCAYTYSVNRTVKRQKKPDRDVYHTEKVTEGVKWNGSLSRQILVWGQLMTTRISSKTL